MNSSTGFAVSQSIVQLNLDVVASAQPISSVASTIHTATTTNTTTNTTTPRDDSGAVALRANTFQDVRILPVMDKTGFIFHHNVHRVIQRLVPVSHSEAKERKNVSVRQKLRQELEAVATYCFHELLDMSLAYVVASDSLQSHITDVANQPFLAVKWTDWPASSAYTSGCAASGRVAAVFVNDWSRRIVNLALDGIKLVEVSIGAYICMYMNKYVCLYI